MKRCTVILALLVVFTSGCGEIKSRVFKSGKDVTAASAMVVTAHPVASLAGARILAGGGNAVDAAVATEFALAVCFPAAGNIGGGGFMVVRLKDGTVNSIDYREMAPSSATEDMYLDEKGNPVDSLSLFSHLSSGIPGTVDGLIRVHEKYGKKKFRDVIQPAIDLANKGFKITAEQARSFNYMRERFLMQNDHNVAFVKDIPWKEGDLLIQPELGATLERIRDRGRDGFYSGETAQMIVAESQRGNGLITLEDLKNYTSKWRDPVITSYRGYKVISMAPPSSGGIILAQLLRMTELTDTIPGGFHDPSEIHLMVEEERRAFADRAQFLGDPDFNKIPKEALINDKYLSGRIADYNPLKATPSDSVTSGNPAIYESEETTHYSIVDQYGNAVAGTTTLNNSYGSAIVVKGAGFILNDQMDDFSSKPGTPNLYGLVGGKANAIAPGKRMLSSMTPTIVEKDKKLYMVLGTPGGSTIITSVFQVIRNVIDYKMTAAQAVAAPRFHHQWLPDIIRYEENGIDSATIKVLESMGHKLAPVGSIGSVEAILIDEEGNPNGAADPRGDDTAVGW